jgi:pentose-5-phosphate-3-epimerase
MTAITKNAPANLSLAGLVQQATAPAAAAAQAEALVVSTTLVESANGRHMLRATLGGLPLARSEFIKQ